MAEGKATKKSGKPKSAGRHSGKRSTYYASHYPANKIKRILRNNGEKAAKVWAEDREVEPIFVRILKSAEYKLLKEKMEIRRKKREESRKRKLEQRKSAQA